MDLYLSNKIAFVAGSSKGIGREIVHAFLVEGARAVITGRNSAAVRQSGDEFKTEFGADRVHTFTGDLTNIEVISRALSEVLERWGTIDCLVGNIGSGTAKPGWYLEPEDWDTVFSTNFWGSVRLVQGALPHMVKTGRGSIVFIASIVGVESINAPITYSTAKAALINYSKNLARQVGPSGIRVNSVAPGNVLFPGSSWERKLTENSTTVESYISSEVPLRRFGKPEEIADLVIFLCSNRASFITGSCFVIDGGQTRTV